MNTAFVTVCLSGCLFPESPVAFVFLYFYLHSACIKPVDVHYSCHWPVISLHSHEVTSLESGGASPFPERLTSPTLHSHRSGRLYVLTHHSATDHFLEQWLWRWGKHQLPSGAAAAHRQARPLRATKPLPLRPLPGEPGALLRYFRKDRLSLSGRQQSRRASSGASHPVATADRGRQRLGKGRSPVVRPVLRRLHVQGGVPRQQQAASGVPGCFAQRCDWTAGRWGQGVCRGGEQGWTQRGLRVLLPAIRAPWLFWPESSGWDDRRRSDPHSDSHHCRREPQQVQIMSESKDRLSGWTREPLLQYRGNLVIWLNRTD